jgi:hypothetical protein
MNLAQNLNLEPLRHPDIEKGRLIHFSRITSKAGHQSTSDSFNSSRLGSLLFEFLNKFASFKKFPGQCFQHLLQSYEIKTMYYPGIEPDPTCRDTFAETLIAFLKFLPYFSKGCQNFKFLE